MDLRTELKKLAAMVGMFLLFFWLPVDWEPFRNSLMEALYLARWYAREHVLLCLVPAFFIAGAIGVFVSQASVMKYLGARANKVLAYGVASVSGSILAVCSCTVLPLFAGIWRMGAGLGPACAFLYSGPAINVLAIILTARILGLDLGIARAVGAIGFSVLIGLIMHLVFRREEMEKAISQAAMPEPEVTRPLSHNALFFAVMIGILVFANWGAPNDFRFALKDGREFHAAVVKAPLEGHAADGVYTLLPLDGPKQGEEVEVSAAEIVTRTPVPGVCTTLWQNKWISPLCSESGLASFWLSLVPHRLVEGTVGGGASRDTRPGASVRRLVGAHSVLGGCCGPFPHHRQRERGGGRLVRRDVGVCENRSRPCCSSAFSWPVFCWGVRGMRG
jgi:uncharacterized membrane protein YraQ (UPF0718 family)